MSRAARFLIAAALALALALGGGAAAQQPSPPDVPLAEGAATTIAVPYAYAYGSDPDDVRSALFHYRLYLPRGYHHNPERTYPAMFIASPLGDAEMGALAARLRADRWVVAMLVESRNRSQSWAPNFIAAHDDLVRRVRVQPGMLFCTGMSGAARVCSVYPGLRPGFRGMILQAAGFWRGDVFAARGNADLVVYGTFGAADPNLHHTIRIRRGLPPTVKRLVEVWDGGHGWAPKPVAERALDWIEDKVFLEGDLGRARVDAAWWYAMALAARFDAAQSAIARYAVARRAQALLARHRVVLDRLTESRLQAVAEAAEGLGNDPALADEIAALHAYRRLLELEEHGHGHGLRKAGARYAALAERLPETAYGRLAAVRARSIAREAALLR